MAKPPTKSPKTAPAKPTKTERDERFPHFAELYIATGNAYQAALTAGYPNPYAKAHSFELAARVRVRMSNTLRVIGMDEVQLARKLHRMLDAKRSQWNRKSETWDKFEDNDSQLRAIDMGLKILDAYPASRLTGPNGGNSPIPIVIKTSIQRPA